jgi:L-ascorbate metabolism protein UlaG (beta-lactamase superfamily)
MKITYLGHACFQVEIKGKYLLFDPFITGNELAKAIDINTIKADYILLTHGHADHIADCESIAKRTNAKVICTWEIHEWLYNKGIANTHPMNTGGKWQFDFGTVACTVAQHSSSLPDGSYGGNPMGFVVYNETNSFYMAGDTALTLDMKLIPLLYPKLDVAILPIGDNFTMDAKQACHCADFVACKNIIASHFDTFGFIKIDHQQTQTLFQSKGLNLTLPSIGQVIEV